MSEQQNLVEFQERLLKKIDAPQKSAAQGDQWLGFETHGHKYAIQLKNIKEVVPAKHKYMGLGGWVRQEVLGALQHKGDLWVVFDGLGLETKNTVATEFWEKRILLLDTSVAGGQMGLSIDKVIGNLPFFEEWEMHESTAHIANDKARKIIRHIKLDAAQTVWRVLDVSDWSKSEIAQSLVKN